MREEAHKQLERARKFILAILRSLDVVDGEDWILGCASDRGGTLFHKNAKNNKNETPFEENCLGKYFHEQLRQSSKNYFDNRAFSNLIAILVGSRPDIFISPVKCVLYWNRLINNNEIHPAMQKQEKDLTKTSTDVDSLTASKLITVMKENKNNYRDINANIKFIDKTSGINRIIYFTKGQQEAILCEKHNVLITGVPGTGKSLILMMRIFIAAQDKSRQKQGMALFSSDEHTSELMAFVAANRDMFIRDYFYGNSSRENLDLDKNSDFFFDEVSMNRLPHCAEGSSKSTLVLTHASATSGDFLRAEWPQFGVFELKTHFRSTKKVTHLWQKYYLNEATKATIELGHQFYGISPEIHSCEHIADLLVQMTQRIRKLTDVEGCSAKDIGIIFATFPEFSFFSEQLEEDNWESSLHKGFLPEFCQVPFAPYNKTNFLIAILYFAWRANYVNFQITQQFEDCVLTISHMILEMMQWPATSSEMRALIIFEFLEIVNDPSNPESLKENLRMQCEWLTPSVKKFKFQQFSRQYLNERTKGVANILFELKRSRCPEPIKDMFAQLATYFGTFEIVSNVPQMYTYERLPSLQFSVVVLYTRSLSMTDQTYRDYLSVAMSRFDFSFTENVKPEYLSRKFGVTWGKKFLQRLRS